MTGRTAVVRAEPIPSRVWWLAAVTGAGAFMAMLDSTVANLAVESIRTDLGVSLSSVQWIVTGYLVAVAVSLPATGWLGRRLGHGRVWAISLAFFTLGSALCALAPDLHTLVLARLVQGLAAGLMVPAGQAVIVAAAGPGQLGRLMGSLGVVVSLGPALGPAVGGLIIDAVDWRWLFWINVPVGVATLAAARRLVPSGPRQSAASIDLFGLGLVATGLPLLLYGGNEAGTELTSPRAAGALVLGALLLVAFGVRSARRSDPAIDLRLFRRPVFARATVITGCTGINNYGGLLLLSLYFQVALGLDAAATGLLLLSMGLGTAAALGVGGWATDRSGAGPVTVVGAGLLFVSMVVFVVPFELPMAVLVVALVVRGVGMALAQMPATAAAYGAVGAAESGDAATVVNIVQRVGGAIGAIAVVAVLGPAGTSATATYRTASAFLLLVSAMTVVLAVGLRRAEANGTGLAGCATSS